MFCTKCRKENKDDASLCVQCGAPLGRQEAPAPQKTSRGKFWKRFGIAVGVLTIIGILADISCSHTTAAPPSVSTNDATGISADQATLNGDLTDLGGSPSVDVSFQWGTRSESYPNETTVATRTDTGTFSIDITSLDQDTTYYYRARAVGSGTRHGIEKSFKTPDLVTKNASEMVLSSNDFEDGWSLAKSEDITALKAGSQSAHEVTFLPQSLTLAMTGVVVEVAVYPSIDLAKDAYSKAMPVTLSVEHPSIGDECTLYLRNYSTEVTFFREKNVVAWVSSGQFEGGSYAHWSESYARKVEAKII